MRLSKYEMHKTHVLSKKAIRGETVGCMITNFSSAQFMQYGSVKFSVYVSCIDYLVDESQI